MTELVTTTSGNPTAPDETVVHGMQTVRNTPTLHRAVGIACEWYGVIRDSGGSITSWYLTV